MATFSGFVAILLWSTTIALTRSLSEQIGPVTAAASVYSVSGITALACLAWQSDKRRQIRQLPRPYLIGCGILFSSYMLLLFLAIGLAKNRQQVLEVGLLNYLWPVLTLLFTVAFLGKTASHLTLLLGTILAIAGLFLVLTQGQHISWKSFFSNLAQNPIAYSLGFTAAISWALYSTLTRKWARGQRTGGVMLFLPATAMALLFICFFTNEPRVWSLRSCIEATFLGLSTYLAYSFWDTAMRAGNMVLVTVTSYLTPFFSTVASCLYLSVTPEPRLWMGCVMLIGGSLLSWFSISDEHQSVAK